MASCSAINSDAPPRTIGTIRPWSEGGEEYLVLEKFPSLRKRFESGLHCLTSEQRSQLRELTRKRESELRGTGAAYLTPLAHKVSLLPEANLAHLALDAVVNASNHWLTPGKGVNGAIHSAAGGCLLEECLSLGGCKVGGAKITQGYDLPAKRIIHTVGPEAKDTNRAELLRSCYWSSLELCRQNDLRTLAFPCISTGAYHYPCVNAADVAIATVRAWLLSDPANLESIDRIVFVTRRLCDEECYAILMLTYFPLV